MASVVRRVFKVLRDTIHAWREDNAERLAAALSYYALFSLVPTLIIVIGLTGLLVDQRRVEDEIRLQIQRLMGSDVADFVGDILRDRMLIDRDSNLLVTAFGVATALFGATAAFAQLQGALNTIWEVRVRPRRGVINFVRTRLFSFVILLLVGFMLILSLVVNTWLVLIDNWFRTMMPGVHFAFNLGNMVVTFGVTMLLFALLFKVMPDVTIRWHDIWVGAGVTAVLFNLGTWVMGLYLGNSALARAFGAAGALVVFLVWIYYSAQIVLFGAEFIKVFSLGRGRAVLPARHAVNVKWRADDQ